MGASYGVGEDTHWVGEHEVGEHQKAKSATRNKGRHHCGRLLPIMLGVSFHCAIVVSPKKHSNPIPTLCNMCNKC